VNNHDGISTVGLGLQVPQEGGPIRFLILSVLDGILWKFTLFFNVTDGYRLSTKEKLGRMGRTGQAG
jgi:hypothetical protein